MAWSAERQRAERIHRLYGLTVEQYDEARAGGEGRCDLCKRQAKVGGFRFKGRLTGFLCYGCRSCIGGFRRFPAQRSLLRTEVQARLARLCPRTDPSVGIEDSISLRDSSQTMRPTDYKYSSKTVIPYSVPGTAGTAGTHLAWMRAQVAILEADPHGNPSMLARFKATLARLQEHDPNDSGPPPGTVPAT